jgi:hypothetical protein
MYDKASITSNSSLAAGARRIMFTFAGSLRTQKAVIVGLINSMS